MESAGEKRFLFGQNPPKWNGEGRGEGGQPEELIHFELQRLQPALRVDSLTETDWQLPR